MDIANKHRPAKVLRPDRAYALLTSEPEIAVVFVHGFLGDPRSTWVDFQHLVDNEEEKLRLWNKCDLFFYTYPSHDQILPLAEDLLSFLHDVVLRKQAFGEAVTPRPYRFPSGFTLTPEARSREAYKHLILVGHSTGAVIIRQAVIEEFKSLDESGELAAWFASKDKISISAIVTASLRFFAPAHRGVLGAGWLGIALTLPLLQLFSTIWLRSNPLYRSLTAGNPVLEDLKEATERFHAKYPETPALKAYCLFGSGDAVVNMSAYQHDKVRPTVRGQTHTTICKPTLDYTEPLEFVTDALFGTAARG